MEQHTAKGRRPRNRKVGTVVSNAMQKSVIIAVTRQMPHLLYKKYVRRTHKFMAHDEENKCRVGDKVEIEETHPLSKRKRWIVREILSRATE
ncbi:MAG: 30S ribosomal protein S17 [Acidobacteria bacterium]|nr:30S ribosomal protein S17 [Acidobacteriota bacterium]